MHSDGDVDGRTVRHERVRRELLAAVVDNMLVNGVGDLPIRRLAALVGVSHGTLIHHFGSKEQLLAEVFGELRAQTVAHIRREDETLTEFWQSLTAEENLRRLRLFFEFYGQALVRPERYHGFTDHVVDDWLAPVTAELIARGWSERDAPDVATIVIAQVRGLLLDLLATGDRARVDAAFERFVSKMITTR